MIKKLLLFLTIATPIYADQIAVSKFGLLNNNSPSVSIPDSSAQDLLNVDVTPGGLSVKKRSGYGLYKALATGQAMHGGYHAFDSSGNDYQLWGSSTSLYAIVADATPTQLVSSATLNSTWDCADTQGNSYCVDSNRDLYLRTNGTTKTWFSSPLGTMVESTPDRVVVAGVSGSPNTLFVSQSNTFTNFTTGVNATDAFTEVIAAPGSRITHIRWGCGKLLWWKDASFGYFDFDDQFSAQVKTVSDVIGTFDNTSAIDPGGRVWFRGQDGHTWMYDCSILNKESIDITPNIQLSGKRTANSWTQSSQSEFQSGSIVPSGQLSTTISVGDVTVSSYTAIENASSQWSLGVTSNITIGANTLTLTPSNTGNINDNDFENGGPNCALSSSWVGSGWGTNVGSLPCATKCTAASGSGLAIGHGSPITGYITDLNANTLASVSHSVSIPIGSCSGYSTLTIPSAGFVGRRVKVKFTDGNGNILTSANSYILGGDITFSYAGGAISGVSGTDNIVIDQILNGSNTITSGWFLSKAYDTGFTSSTVQIQSDFIANTSTPSYAVQSSTSAVGVWSTVLTSTGTNAVANRYLRYSSTISISGIESAATSISTVTLIATSSGSFYSAIKNAPNLTAWSTFGANQVLNGGTQSFFIRSSTNTFSILSATPSWNSQSVGGLISISTGTFFQIRDDFAVTIATQTPTLNDFSVNWFEGSASDQAYMIYFDNAIWESVAFGAGQSVNNYIFRYDLLNDGWGLYNFGAGGLLVQANTIYFGDTAAGNVYNYGTTTADNGTAINAYWRSKSFTSPDTFLQSVLTNIDTFAKKNQGTSLTASYTVENSTTTSYTISLSTGNASFIQSRKLLPSGKTGYTFDMKYGDTSASSAWEILGFRIGFTQNPYRPTN